MRYLRLILPAILLIATHCHADAITDRVSALEQRETSIEARQAVIESRLGIATTQPVVIGLPDGYVRVADEATTFDVGPTPVGVAYGAANKFILRTMSGKVFFGGPTFGDPAVGVRKSGYVFRGIATTQPVAQAGGIDVSNIDTTSSRHTIELAIVDGTGTPTDHAKYLAATGMVGVREWLGVDWTTGRIGGGGIDRCNAWAAAGYAVVATASPDELASRKGRAMCPDFGVAAIDLLRLDPRVIIQLGNEMNMPTYGIGGSFAIGCRTFELPIARKIRAADPTRQIASASIVWQTPAYYAQQWAPVLAETAGLIDFVDIHDYTLDPKNFDDVLAAGGSIAAQLSAKLMCSEWGGFSGTGPTKGEPLAAVLAAERASIRNRTDVAAYFIAQRVAKFGDDYAWLWDFNGGKTTATYAAMVATSQPTTQPSAKRLFIDATFTVAAWPARVPAGYLPAVVEPGGRYRDPNGLEQSYYVGGYYGPNADLDLARVRAAAASLPAGTLYAIDNETPAWSADARDANADVPAALARYTAWLGAMRQGNAGVRLASYDTLPIRSLYDPMYQWRADAAFTHWQTGATLTGDEAHDIAYGFRWMGATFVRDDTIAERGQFLAWQRANDRVASLPVDALTPSFYLFTPGQDVHGYVEGMSREARRVAGARPVYPFVWPRWHTASSVRIPLDVWRPYVRSVLSLNDGLVLWGVDAGDAADLPYIDICREEARS